MTLTEDERQIREFIMEKYPAITDLFDYKATMVVESVQVFCRFSA